MVKFLLFPQEKKKGPSIKDVHIKGGRGVSQMQTAVNRGEGVGEMRMSAF